MLPKDYTKQSQVEIVLREISEKLAKLLRSHEKLTGKVRVYIHYSKHETAKGFVRQRKITPTNRTEELTYGVILLFRKYYKESAGREESFKLRFLFFYNPSYFQRIVYFRL
ncbi:hypothetical protein PJ962_002565 [Enterococcus faecalis]|nr:hypothetical protein [Enterococcus faecalis]EKK0901623.1 hypothetical protein [Enterococcus faecalis]EMC0706636.1 hypothetical protein [Enterococcus faecalis]